MKNIQSNVLKENGKAKEKKERGRRGKIDFGSSYHFDRKRRVQPFDYHRDNAEGGNRACAVLQEIRSSMNMSRSLITGSAAW